MFGLIVFMIIEFETK